MASVKTDADSKNSALVTGRGVAGNPNLERVVNAVMEGYKPNRIGKSVSQIRIDHTAMKPLEKPIYGIRELPDGTKVPKLLFRAGWYVSAEENYIIENLMKDKETLDFNKRVWAAMEKAGLEVEKQPAELADAKVVS